MSCQFEHTDKGEVFWWGGLNHLDALLKKYDFTGVDVMPGLSNGALAHITLTAPDSLKKYEESPEGILVVVA